MLQLRPMALLAAILAAAAFRLLPHPMNVSPIAAMGLFGGAYLTNRFAAFLAPLGAMLLSDLVLGFYPHMEFIYAALALTVCIGWLLRRDRSPARVAGAALAGSVVFFVISNFSVWALWNTYPHTTAGLVACYVAAIPFFQNTVFSDLFFAAALFGGFSLAERLAPALRAAPGVQANPA